MPDNITCLPISKDAGIVAHECVVQQTLPEALEHHILTCINIGKTHTVTSDTLTC